VIEAADPNFGRNQFPRIGRVSFIQFGHILGSVLEDYETANVVEQAGQKRILHSQTQIGAHRRQPASR
jgi:hypothetical protein